MHSRGQRCREENMGPKLLVPTTQGKLFQSVRACSRQWLWICLSDLWKSELAVHGLCHSPRAPEQAKVRRCPRQFIRWNLTYLSVFCMDQRTALMEGTAWLMDRQTRGCGIFFVIEHKLHIWSCPMILSQRVLSFLWEDLVPCDRWHGFARFGERHLVWVPLRYFLSIPVLSPFSESKVTSISSVFNLP